MGRQAWVGWTERGRDERGRDELDVQDGRAYLRSRQERAQASRLARSGSTYCGRAKSARKPGGSRVAAVLIAVAPRARP